MFKKIKTNISKNMVVKQRLPFTDQCADQKASKYFCSQKTFFINLILCDCYLGPTGGVEFFQMLVLLKCTWLHNYKQLMQQSSLPAV